MKKFKNRKYVIHVKNVNNAVKNNANMDGYEELVKAAKEFKGALDDEVANREYERKKSKKNKPASKVEELKAELENLNAHFKGVCAERDNLAACLKACEKDLKLKQDEAITMRQEAVYQFKRAEKAEAFIKQIDGACDLIKKHIAAYGSKKKSK